MALRFPTTVSDPRVQQCFDFLARLFPVQDANLSSPVVRGVILTTGAVFAGTGFTSERVEAGKYVIKLNMAMVTQPVPIVSSNTASRFLNVSATKTEITVEARNSAGVLTDATFAFMVMKS